MLFLVATTYLWYMYNVYPRKILKVQPYVAIQVLNFDKNNESELKLLKVLSKKEIKNINKHFPRDYTNDVQKHEGFKDSSLLMVTYSTTPFSQQKETEETVQHFFYITPSGHIVFQLNLVLGTVKHYVPHYVKAVYEICDKNGIKHPLFKPKKDTTSMVYGEDFF